MSRLNFSSLNDAWGVPDNTDTIAYKHSYKKPKEIGMTINSNEIKNLEPIKETYSGYIKPCSLVEEHISKCEICRNKLLENISPQNDSIVDKLINQTEHMTSSITQEYLDTNFNISEHFENISPSQKNLIIIVLYGILIILISDLIINEKNE